MQGDKVKSEDCAAGQGGTATEQLQALRDEFYAAMITMRNYYAQAISRAAVDEILARGLVMIQQTDAVLAALSVQSSPPEQEEDGYPSDFTALLEHHQATERSLDKAREALALCVRCIRAHDNWCGYKTDSPGDGIINEALGAAGRVLAAPANPPSAPSRAPLDELLKEMQRLSKLRHGHGLHVAPSYSGFTAGLDYAIKKLAALSASASVAKDIAARSSESQLVDRGLETKETQNLSNQDVVRGEAYSQGGTDLARAVEPESPTSSPVSVNHKESA